MLFGSNISGASSPYRFCGPWSVRNNCSLNLRSKSVRANNVTSDIKKTPLIFSPFHDAEITIHCRFQMLNVVLFSVISIVSATFQHMAAIEKRHGKFLPASGCLFALESPRIRWNPNKDSTQASRVGLMSSSS